MENIIGLFAMVALIALCSSFVQSVTGFAFGIISMIFLPILMPYTEANALSPMLSMLTSLTVAIAMRKSISYKNLIFTLLGCAVSTYAAVEFIKTQANDTLILLLGIALVLLSVYFFFFSDKIRIVPTWYTGLLVGLISGAMDGLFSIGGPPVVIYYMQSEKSFDRYLATLSAFFVASGVITTVTKAAAGFVTENVLICFAAGVVGMLIGSLAGKLTRDKIKPNIIRKAVYAVMAISGIINIFTSIL